MKRILGHEVAICVLAAVAGTACGAGEEGGRPASDPTFLPGTSAGGTPAVVGGGTGGTTVVGGAGGAGGVGGGTPPPPPVTGGVGGIGGAGGLDGLAGAAGAAVTAGTDGGGVAPFPVESACLEGIDGYFAEGPFSYQMQTAGAVKMWVPMVPAGCKVPVIHLANGTGGTCSAYLPVHQRFASHGFLATCYESGQTGAGTQGLEAFQTALSMYPELATKRFGSTGHSQGGQAAFTVLQLAEAEWGAEGVFAGLAMEPASGFGAQPSGGTWQQVYAMITSPMFMFSGTSDSLVSESWVSRGFAALNDDVEAYNWSALGATHIPVPNGETMEVGVAWFRWKLLDDQDACRAFKALEGAGTWTSVEEQNVQPCL